jgi:hypothetical protein
MATDECPFDYRAVWEGKPALRAIYRSYYKEILARCRPGRTLEHIDRPMHDAVDGLDWSNHRQTEDCAARL